MRTTLLTPWQDFVARPIRQIKTQNSELFLTFDDGPDPNQLDAILEILEIHQAKATFFMVANAAQRNVSLVQKVVTLGHAVGDHSLDHSYSLFFSSRPKLKDWIVKSQSILEDLTGQKPVGFRPPNGVCTPPLASALKELNVPLILWRERFFDTAFTWTKIKAEKSLALAQAGDIILLHDKMKETLFKEFLPTLQFYLRKGTELNYKWAPLKNDFFSVTLSRDTGRP